MDRILVSILGISLFAIAPATRAQTSDNWKFSLAPYAWLADSSGSSTVLGFDSSVDLDFFDDVTDNIDQAFQFHFEASKDRWVFILDPTYLQIKTIQSVRGVPLETNAKSVIVDVKAGLTLNDPLQVLWGLRFYESDLDISVPQFGISQDESWVDLVAGARYKWDLGERWVLTAEGDVGGFDIGDSSDLSWNANIVVTYRFNSLLSLAMGYRVLNIDYDSDAGSREFRYDIRNNGPQIGVNFDF